MILFTLSKKNLPESVSSTFLFVRRNKRAPISSSNCLICLLNGGWLMFKRFAALVKFNSSATILKYFRCRNSIKYHPFFTISNIYYNSINYILDILLIRFKIIISQKTVNGFKRLLLFLHYIIEKI